MASNWREAVAELLPGFMRMPGAVSERLSGYIALLFDQISLGTEESLYGPWLLEPTSPDDILPYIGAERGMPRYPGETAAQYRQRLWGAWDAWTYAGNESSIISQLELFGLSDIEIKTAHDWDWDSLAPSIPGKQGWEQGVGGPANWSRFWVVIKGHPWTATTDIDGLTATAEQIQTVRSICQKWKSVESLNPWIIIVLDPVTWATEQPDGTWYDHRNRSRAAQYIDGRGQRPVLLP